MYHLCSCVTKWSNKFWLYENDSSKSTNGLNVRSIKLLHWPHLLFGIELSMCTSCSLPIALSLQKFTADKGTSCEQPPGTTLLPQPYHQSFMERRQESSLCLCFPFSQTAHPILHSAEYAPWTGQHHTSQLQRFFLHQTTTILFFRYFCVRNKCFP